MVRGRPIPFALLLFVFFSSCISRCLEPMEEYGGYMVVVCVCGHAFGRAWWFVVLFYVRHCPLGALLRNILGGFLIDACVAIDMIYRMHGAVTYLFVIPLFSRGPWSCFLCLYFGVSPFVVFASFFFFLTRTSRLAPMARTLLGGLENAMFHFFVAAARLCLVFASIHLLRCWSAHKSLAPRTRTLLGVLGQATLIFGAVATLLFFFFCECPKFCDLAKQQRKIFVGVSEVGKTDFALYFFWLCVFFLVFYFLLLQARDDTACLLLPPHPQPVGSGPPPHARKDEWSGVGERPTPDARHPGKRRPPPGTLMPPPQRAKPARKSARCGVGDGSQRPHPPHPQPVGSGPRPQARTDERSGVGERPTPDAPHQ